MERTNIRRQREGPLPQLKGTFLIKEISKHMTCHSDIQIGDGYSDI